MLLKWRFLSPLEYKAQWDYSMFFAPSVFQKKISHSGSLKLGLRGKELTHSHTMTFLTPLGNKPFENTVGIGETARNEQFLLFSQCFLSIWITCCHFCQI